MFGIGWFYARIGLVLLLTAVLKVRLQRNLGDEEEIKGVTRKPHRTQFEEDKYKGSGNAP